MFIRRANGSNNYDVFSNGISMREYLGTVHRSLITYSNANTGETHSVYRYFAYTPDYCIVPNIASSSIAFKSVSDASIVLVSSTL